MKEFIASLREQPSPQGGGAGPVTIFDTVTHSSAVSSVAMARPKSLDHRVLPSSRRLMESGPCPETREWSKVRSSPWERGSV